MSYFFHMHNFCNPNNTITEGLTYAAFYKLPKHHQCITVKQCQPVPGDDSESTTVTVNNSTQPVCNITIVSVYRHQQADQLLNYHWWNVNVMLQCLRMDLKKMCMSSVLSCIQHHLAVKTCAYALKSLSTATVNLQECNSTSCRWCYYDHSI